jgi:hypothetical protein
MRLRFVNSIGLGGSIALMCVIGLAPARIFAQGPGDAVLDKTTFGHSQNDGRDIVNSLIPGEKKFGKGEKKLEVNSGDLKSKQLKDTTFGGSLLNMGIVGAEPKLDESKRPVAVESERDSSSVKQPAATRKEPLLQLSDSTILQQQAEQSDIAAVDKEPKATGENISAAAGSNETQKKQAGPADPAKDQKSSTASSDKPTKPDGDR